MGIYLELGGGRESIERKALQRKVLHRVYFSNLYVDTTVTVTAGGCLSVTIHCRIEQCILRRMKTDTEEEGEWTSSKIDSASIIIGEEGDETERIERAIRHAIKIAGGKEDPFR